MGIRKQSPIKLEALQILIGYLDTELCSIIAMHGPDSFIRVAVREVLGEAGMTEAQLLEEWQERATHSG